MYKKVFFYFLFFILVFFSCKEEAEINVPEVPKKLVVSSIFSPDSTFKVQLKESNAGNAFKKADMQLFSKGSLVGSLEHVSNGIYKIPEYSPTPGNEYRLHITSNDHKTITASDYLPEPIPILKITHTDSAGVNDIGNYYATMNLTFTDPSEQANYYEIIVTSQIDTSTLEYNEPNIMDTSWLNHLKEDLVFQVQTVFSYDPIVQSRNADNMMKHSLVFNDEQIDNKEYQLLVNYHPYYTHLSSIYAKHRKITLYLRSISKNYYLYKKRLYHYNQYNSGSDILKDPSEFVRLYSNIEDGYGLFAGYSVSKDSIIVTGKN